MARKSSTPARRGPSPTVTKLKKRLESVSRSKSQQRKRTQERLATIAGGAGLGALERWNVPNPIDIPELPDGAVYGPLLFMLGEYWLTGKMGDWVTGMGVGISTCAVRDIVAEMGADAA